MSAGHQEAHQAGIIMTLEEKLLGVLRHALWGVPFDEETGKKDAGELIALADKQAVAGLIIDALIKKDVRMEQMTLFEAVRHKRYWEDVLAKSSPSTIIISGEEVRIMEPTLYAAYLFMHLFFHFIKEGIGLRHLCDWAVMMHHYADEIDKGRLEEVLRNVGMLKAFLAFGTILADKLGMKDFPLVLSEKDRKCQARIMKEIMHSGNFGRGKRHISAVGLWYKLETMLYVLSNCVNYFSLAPKELVLIPYRRVAVNWRLMRDS